MNSNNQFKRTMYNKPLLSIFIIFLIVIAFNCVRADSGSKTSSHKIGPLIKNAIQDRGFSDRDLIKVIVVINRDHLKPLPEEIIGELKRRVEQLGGHIGNHAYNNVQVWIPTDKIEELAEWDEIKMIDKPLVPSSNSIISEGAGVIGATEWNNTGFTGKGVKVGIVDIGFQGYDSLLGTELPSSVVTKVMSSNSDFLSTNHGTACAEIVHDVAPDAELFLVNAGDWNVDFHNAVSWLQSQGVNIISSSIGINLRIYCEIIYDVLSSLNVDSFLLNVQYIEELKEQWGSTINNAVLQGITWSQAAGNEGKKAWSGPFLDLDGDYYLNFSEDYYEDYNEIQLSNFQFGQEVYVLMAWDWDHAGSTYDDYDLYIKDQSEIIVCSSIIDQILFPVGVESCKFTPVPGIKYYAWVFKYRAVPQQIALLLGTDEFPNFKYYNPEETVALSPPADNPNVITVGAVSYSHPYRIKTYSSQGPANGIIKPDLVAPDCVSTASYSQIGFCGTSAATPHVAGLCGLIKQAYPDWSPNQIKSYLESNAIDLGALGKDNTYGSGLVQLPTPPNILKPNLTPYRPSGWSDKIVASNIIGTNTDSNALYQTDTLYIDWAVINNGTVPTSAIFYYKLYVDGMEKQTWFTTSPQNYVTYVTDYSIGTLSAGTHTIKIVVDTTNVIDESNESDNEYIKTITVTIFSDVPPGYWAEDYINAIFNAHITTGCSQNPLKYCPENNVTREEMAAFIVRAVVGEPPLNYCDSGVPFPDVSFDMWSCRYIKRLKELEITTGYGDGTYGPYDEVLREQMAAFLVRAVEGEPPLTYCDSGSLFTDVTPDMWSCRYVKRLKELEITTGHGDGRYGPYDFVTRAQMAAFLSRAFLGME